MPPENVMGDVVILPVIRTERERELDGGKARIRRRRAALNLSEPFTVDELTMRHADPAGPAPCELCGQTGDCA